MDIKLNGENLIINENHTVEALLNEKKLNSSYIAVSLNNKFLQRSNWSSKTLENGDELEVVSPMVGG